MFANNRKYNLCSVRTNIAFPYTKYFIIIIIITVIIVVIGRGGGECLDFGALFYFFFL